MRPLRLIIDGFGSYRAETEIDFTDVDFFALVGPTGAGKSTVIDALCFALYGTVPRWDNEKEVRNALAPSANACRVSLIFELAGQRYVAVRSLQRDRQGRVTTKAARLERLDPSIPPTATLTAMLEASVEQLAEGPDNVKTAVQDLLGLSYEHFTQSVLLPQGGFAEFLRATPAKRQQLLVELLAFGIYKEAGQRARVRADRAEVERDAAQRARDQLGGATEAAESAAAARLAALTALAEQVEIRLATVTELQNQAATATDRVTTERNAAVQLAAVRTPADVGGLAEQVAAADGLVAGARQRRDEAAELASQADASRAALPDKATVQQQLGMHQLRGELTADAERQAAGLAERRERAAKLFAELEAADLDAAAAQQADDAAKRAHAAAGLAEALHVGDDCPVCRQRVHALPPQEPPADLDAARTALARAVTAQRAARSAHADADKAAAAAESELAATQRRLETAAQVMADVPPESELTRQHDAITAADADAASARTEATARQHELAAAERARESLRASEQRAWAVLRAARDTLIALGVPALESPDLAAAWAVLTNWASGEADRRTRTLPELEAAAAGLQRQARDAAGGLVLLLAEHDIAAEPLTRAPAEVAAHSARAEAALQQIRADRARAARLDQQIADHKANADVATMLGNLLRANRFETWLCSEALDSLVREASATLLELSGGQYELDRDERNDLVVIDYADAGTRRPVHTLSGGETFQASLALALALSHQVIGLSAGMRELNSMFLDEGFGTLDNDTLDMVASTLERLAADSDRMVGVITHVAELAERVPVRFVVSRTGTTSAIVRERG
ncbi:MAG TPA: SMC family ATPase [Streptosporangiaceae bacterium]|nr:SMC family ATPase [Streptosporangiaceae bacterium]